MLRRAIASEYVRVRVILLSRRNDGYMNSQHLTPRHAEGFDARQAKLAVPPGCESALKLIEYEDQSRVVGKLLQRRKIKMTSRATEKRETVKCGESVNRTPISDMLSPCTSHYTNSPIRLSSSNLEYIVFVSRLEIRLWQSFVALHTCRSAICVQDEMFASHALNTSQLHMLGHETLPGRVNLQIAPFNREIRVSTQSKVSINQSA